MLTAEEFAGQLPLFGMPEWLAFALADLLATVANMFCSAGADRLSRSDVLRSWGLLSLADDVRAAAADADAQHTQSELAAFVANLTQKEV